MAGFYGISDSLYLNTILKKGMVKAIENAIDAMSPADLYIGRGTTNIGKNRSAADPENPLDKTLDVLEAKNSEGKVTGILFIAACHAVFNNDGRNAYTISANFPGTARDIIRAKTGTNAIFIQDVQAISIQDLRQVIKRRERNWQRMYLK